MKKRPISLDDWYRFINSIYIDRNFYRAPSSVFSHLVEVIGGLSSSVSHKEKVGSDSSVYLAKALGWWMALCGNVKIKSVEAMIWSKFPFVCPYCKRKRHKDRGCKEYRESNKGIDWNELEIIGKENEKKRPQTLISWQRMFDEIYVSDGAHDKKIIFGRLSEELGELAEGIRLLPVSAAYFMNEAVDVFAWIMRYANNEELELQTKTEKLGEMLEEALWKEYPGKCKVCKSKVCKCAPVIIGKRLSREMELDAFRNPDLGLFTFEEMMEMFKLGDSSLKIREKEIKITTDLLEDMVETTGLILSHLVSIEVAIPSTLEEAMEQIINLAAQQQIAQENIDVLVEAVNNSPSQTMQSIRDFMINVAASAFWNNLLGM